MAEERKAILLRISPAMWAELNGWAEDDLRSLNGQIEFLLREALRRRKKSVLTSAEEEGGKAQDGKGESG